MMCCQRTSSLQQLVLFTLFNVVTLDYSKFKVAKMLNEIPNKHREQTSKTTARIPHLNTEQEMYVKKVPIYR